MRFYDPLMYVVHDVCLSCKEHLPIRHCYNYLGSIGAAGIVHRKI